MLAANEGTVETSSRDKTADGGGTGVGGLKASDPNTLLNLYASLYDMNGVAIQKKVNAYIAETTGASYSLIIQLLKECRDAAVQVIGSVPLEQELRFTIESKVLNEVVSESKCIQTVTQELDKCLIEVLNKRRGNSTILAVPVENPNGEVVFIVCLVFSNGQNNISSDYCQAIVQECFRYCLGTIANTLAYEDEKRLHQQCQTLLFGASNLFSRVGDVCDLMKEIVWEACRLTCAESCSMFLVESGNLVSKVFDGRYSTEEIRLSIGQGIAGHVAATGKLINIRDAYSHPLFYKAIDKKTGFKTRNILCFPIMNKDEVVGVVELCNKKGGFHFDVFDEEVAMAFSIYCGISIMHSLVYKKIQDAQARNQLSNELMMYHMKVEDKDVQAIVESHKKQISSFPDFFNYSFSTRLLSHEVSVPIAFELFNELNLTTQFSIRSDYLARFLLYVQRGYRTTPYHNWDHAFAVFHLAAVLIKNLNLTENQHLTWVESLALLVATICHDIDHRGTTNQFQMASGTVLASLYSSEGSVMERHHVAQTMCILNTEGCNIVSCLDATEYKVFIDLVSRLILATDLANHFRIMEQQEKMAKEGFDPTNWNQRELLMYLLMTCCDLSDQIKPWEICHLVTELVYREFFSQGDLEKAMGSSPSEMMDRRRAKIPDLQIQFITTVVLPTFRVLDKLYPEKISSCLTTIENNLRHWELVKEKFMQQWEEGCSSIDLLKHICEK
ncbi:cGMP-dependent 3',5'-cyclic phosphodiesterase-like [Lycorma delicatula]|uniref:cGMP-dependent 3',5'-cyclic phosphodiesterase-like n=1 Tax=Lycorma delicatula TaxID=130591 RepID=UPI003F51A5D1